MKNMERKNFGQKVLYSPVTKIIIGFFVFAVIYIIHAVTFKRLSGTDISQYVKYPILEIFISILVIVSYSYLYKVYEKRKITEFSTNGIAKNLTVGVILGAIIQSLTILVIYLKESYTVISVNPIVVIIPPFTMMITVAILEETLFRGVIFRIIEEKLGSYIALLISAILFGAAHIFNPNSSLIAVIGIAIAGGVLLATAYMYSRNLWFPVAIHFAWNFVQCNIFGLDDSGTEESNSLITSKIEGSELFTGGAFGVEGSIQASVICLIASTILLILCHKKGRIVKPYWNKNTGR
jgi:membrane protease YdiL (CAAX protease family)